MVGRVLYPGLVLYSHVLYALVLYRALYESAFSDPHSRAVHESPFANLVLSF